MIERACILIPAFDAARTLRAVVESIRATLPECEHAIVVVDDGSSDQTAELAVQLGCLTLSHLQNRGKGAAIRTGLEAAVARGWDVALTVDADGQHPASAAREVMLASDDPGVLVLGVRDLERDGAPRKNRASNGISNFFLSKFAGRRLRDTQCGLRRYPVRATLALGGRGTGYDFEGEIVLRAAWTGMPIVEKPVTVIYPDDRVTHFDAVRDPWRIVRTVVRALGERHVGL